MSKKVNSGQSDETSYEHQSYDGDLIIARIIAEDIVKKRQENTRRLNITKRKKHMKKKG